MNKTYTQNDITFEDLVVAIETNDDGTRQAHLYGYGYYAYDEEPEPCRFVEYTFFYVPLDEVLQKGLFEVESEYCEEIKQYITDCTEEKMHDIYTHYDNGNCPKPITLAEFNASLPDGTYVVQYPAEKRA